MSNPQETVLEINLAHLSHNYTYLKSRLSPEVKLMAVVKAAGYGSDAVIMAKHLEKIGVDQFAVAYVSEGVALRKEGITLPILVLHPQPVNFPALIKHTLQPSLYSFRVLIEFIRVAENANCHAYPVHLKFNTGLYRIGFRTQDIEELMIELRKTKTVRVQALLSHLAASEDHSEREFTMGQINSFKNITEAMSHELGYKPVLHQSNTSGILNYPEAHFDMVRTGIGLYGFGNEAQYDQNLKPVSSLKSVISQIHTLQPGDTLGYNRAFKATEIIRTATIPIGHADGIGRIYGNKRGVVTIHGKKAFIIGNVCMDMIMVDITSISCKEGDEVIIFDHQISATSISEHAGTISYELLTAISPRVKRRIVNSI